MVLQLNKYLRYLKDHIANPVGVAPQGDPQTQQTKEKILFETDGVTMKNMLNNLNKINKKILLSILLMTLCFIIMPNKVEAGLVDTLTWGDELTSGDTYATYKYKPDSTNTYAWITLCTPTGTEVVFPSYINGLKVVYIANPNATLINRYNIFGQKSTYKTVTKITLPETLDKIGNYAFYNCSGFTGDLVIPEGVTSIGSSAFSYCSGFTGDLVIPEGVTSIGESAFYNCSGFDGELVIPEGVTSIGDDAFENCSGLTGDLVIPSSVTRIGSGSFVGCGISNIYVDEANTKYKSEDGILFNIDGTTLIQAPAGKKMEKDYIIPEGVTSIGERAFYNCSGFTGSLTIPEGVTSIGYCAFYNCSGFDGELVIPEGVTSIGRYAFYNCSGFDGELVIPEGVTSIGDDAFENCSGFTGSLTIPKGVTSIGGSAFENCSGFDGELVIPEGVTSIGYDAFRGCSGFTGSLTIPEGVTSIGGAAFYNCSGFSGDLVIPDSVTSIERSAFNGCTGLDYAILPNLIPAQMAHTSSYTSFSSVKLYALTPESAKAYNELSGSYWAKENGGKGVYKALELVKTEPETVLYNSNFVDEGAIKVAGFLEDPTNLLKVKTIYTYASDTTPITLDNAESLPSTLDTSIQGTYKATYILQMYNSEKDVYEYVTNSNGELETVSREIIVSTGITVVLKQDGDLYNGKWTNIDVTAVANCENGENITAYQYKYSGTDTWIDIVENSFTINHNFSGEVIMRGLDVTGNVIAKEGSSKVLKIDKELPTINSASYKTEEKTLVLSISASDIGSGLLAYAITSNENEEKNWEKALVLQTGKIEIDVGGTETYYLWVKDNAGNVSEVKVIKAEKDVTAPSGDIRVIEAYKEEIIEGEKIAYTNNLNVTLEITTTEENTEGMQMAILKESEFNLLKSEADIVWEPYVRNKPWVIEENKDEKLYLILKDAAGNTSSEMGEVKNQNAEYTVYHYLENIEDENYTLYKNITKTNTSGRTIKLENESIRIEGATYIKGTLEEGGVAKEEVKVEADGSTKIYLYYDRNEYELVLNNNSYITEVTGAGTYKYGERVAIGATLVGEEGYKFVNWSTRDYVEIEDEFSINTIITMPAENITLTAIGTYLELAQAVYTQGNTTLTFVKRAPISVGDTFNGYEVTAVYTGIEEDTYEEYTNVPWYNYVETITTVVIEDEIQPESTRSWFDGMSNLTSINLEKLDTINVKDMAFMFYNCSSLTSLNVSEFKTENVLNMSAMFYNCCKLSEIDVGKWVTNNVIDTSFMFSGTKDTSMNIETLDLTSWNTENVIKMNSMFQSCSKLKSIIGIEKFDTSKVELMNNMFNNCNALETLDLSEWVTEKVTTMGTMFQNCNNLKILDLSNWNTSNVENMSYMFLSCNSLTNLDVSGFDTIKVTNMKQMFTDCSKLKKLNLSTFNTSNVTDASHMFNAMNNLEEITLGANFKFKGTDVATGSLPTPSSSFITGADEHWYNSINGYRYTAEDIANGVKLSGDTTSGTITYIAVDPRIEVTFNANGGQIVGVNAGTKIIKAMVGRTYGEAGSGLGLPEAIWEGHVFLGWFTKAEDGTEITADMTLVQNANHIVYAQWEEVSTNLITFTIAGDTYYAEEGMTWAKWLDSSYNNGMFVENSYGYISKATDTNENDWLSDAEGGAYSSVDKEIVSGAAYTIMGRPIV